MSKTCEMPNCSGPSAVLASYAEQLPLAWQLHWQLPLYASGRPSDDRTAAERPVAGMPCADVWLGSWPSHAVP